MKNTNGNMESGKPIPRSGTYGFYHAHSSTREITLLKDRIFPSCFKCSDPVHFVLIRPVPVESALERFRLLTHGPVGKDQPRTYPAKARSRTHA